MTKNELICKLKFLDYTQDTMYKNLYAKTMQNWVQLNINDQDLALIFKHKNYILYKDVIKHLINLDK